MPPWVIHAFIPLLSVSLNHSKNKNNKNIQIKKKHFFSNKPWPNQVIFFPFYFFNQILNQSNSILSHFSLILKNTNQFFICHLAFYFKTFFRN